MVRNTHAQNQRIKENQRLRPRRRVIAHSARLAEYQRMYGHSAIRLLKQLEADVANEPVAWRQHRVDAFKTIMSGYTTLAGIRGDEADHS